MTDATPLGRLLAAVPALPRPLILLEDGAGRAGTARLAWGAERRFRIEWDAGSVGDLPALRGVVPTGRRAYGSIAYDLGLPPRAVRRTPLVPQPLADFFVPAHELVIDLETGGVMVGDPEALGEATAGGNGAPAPEAPNPYTAAALLTRSFDQPGFEAAVGRIKSLIAKGDVYQVNLALAELFALPAPAWDVYRRLREINPSPWMGFADFGDWQLVSGSPELLVELRHPGPTAKVGGARTVRARPIAGTRKKTGDPSRDAVMRSELALDEKERAEHRMLLDLARNDLGRVSAFGSVHVSEREVIEEYSHVFHLVSEVVGELSPGMSPWDVMAATFPGGTITGAPKIRAMEIIAELEPVARGAYTGALGWIGDDELQLNILIRSAVVRDERACVQAGAGIVWDSDPTREWRESLRKGHAMRAALGVPAVRGGAHV